MDVPQNTAQSQRTSMPALTETVTPAVALFPTAYALQKQQKEAQWAATVAAKEAAKEAHRKAMVDLMEANYKRWHQKNEEQLASDIQQAEDKAAADAAERQRRCVHGLLVGVLMHCVVMKCGE